MNKDLESILNINSKFLFLNRELRKIELKLIEVEGVWFFKVYKYTREQLLEDPIVDKIFTAMKIIENDLTNWVYSGAVSERVVEEYFNMQKEFIQKLEDMQTKIIERKPKNWEQISGGFKIVIALVLDSFPVLQKIGSYVKLLTTTEKEIKLLSKGSVGE